MADVAVWKKMASILNFRVDLLIFMAKAKTQLKFFIHGRDRSVKGVFSVREQLT